MKQKILNKLKDRTKKNPIFSGSLETEFGLMGTQVRDIIRQLRREGYEICSNEKGYWMAQTSEEVDDIIKNLKSRSLSMLETITSLQRRSYQMKYRENNQEEMFKEGK